MKQLIVIALMLTLIVWAGCGKNKEYCWECITQQSGQINPDGSASWMLSGIDTICNVSESEISDYEYQREWQNTKEVKTCEKY